LRTGDRDEVISGLKVLDFLNAGERAEGEIDISSSINNGLVDLAAACTGIGNAVIGGELIADEIIAIIVINLRSNQIIILPLTAIERIAPIPPRMTSSPSSPMMTS